MPLSSSDRDTTSQSAKSRHHCPSAKKVKCVHEARRAQRLAHSCTSRAPPPLPSSGGDELQWWLCVIGMARGATLVVLALVFPQRRLPWMLHSPSFTAAVPCRTAVRQLRHDPDRVKRMKDESFGR